MGVRIGIGFLVVLVLMIALSAIGLRYAADANQRLKNIAQNNNVKIELATEMHRALRERALLMHALPILTDPFDKDSEIQRFNSLGARYIQARQHLESMPLNPRESETLDRILELTRDAQPEVQRVVDMSWNADEQKRIFDRIRNVAMPKQRAIAEEVSALLQLQREQTSTAVQRAETSYDHVRNLMLGLGTAALLVGVGIAFFVSRRVTRQAIQLAAQALYDPLTGLANRCLLQDRLQHEIARSKRSNTPFGVALMDLDRFKEVNDTLGHDVGDQLLRDVGNRLRDTVRKEDTVARLGGDEFVVLIHNVDAHSAPVVANKLLNALDRPFLWQGHSIDLGASLGIALYHEQCSDGGELIRYADIAMYAAKRSGLGHALYTPDQASTEVSDLSLKSELRKAIESDDLSLYYQPQIDHRKELIIGVEALLRWSHSDRGFLDPEKFIPLAEQAGLITPLTQWVLKTAIAQLAILHRQGHRLNLAVNLSVRNLHDMELPARIRTLLTDNDMPAEYLTLEITEGAIMANQRDGLTILTELDRMGVTLAIDDFGTGYSSLAYLKRLPVDELKIDKSFVLDMEENDNDAIIVRSTIDLAHNLGLTVTAEGVETRGTWETLAVLGCDHSQGYFFGKPMPAEELDIWLRDSAWSTCPAESILAAQ